MWLIRFAIENPVKVAVSVILVVLFGVLALFEVGIQLIPDVDRPIITVRTRWPGAAPQEIESEIVDEQEEKLKNVTGLRKMTSSSTYGQAEIRLEFPVGIDKDTAYRDVSDKLRQVGEYPEEVEEPTLSTSDSDMAMTIAWMILYAKDGEDVSHLKTFLEDSVKPILERAEGISEVAVYGGREREVQVEVDPFRLAARGLTLRDVERTLRRQNENVSAGTIEQGKRDFSYRAIGEFTNLQEVEDTVIEFRDGGPVLVRDVATVIDGFRKAESFTRSKGRPVIAMPARRDTGANVITAMANLKEQLAIVNREILSSRGLNLELTQVYDETTYIWSSIRLVIHDIFYGGLLTLVVLWLALRSMSATGIIATSIPISIIGTFLILALLGRGLNVILLAGLAFAVGTVVDNAIVVLENIHRHRSMGKSRTNAAFDGTKEVWGAVLASTLTSMAVFLPVITIQEEAGQLFKDIAIAISASMAISLFVSIFVIPPLACRFFGGSAGFEEEKPWRLAQWLAGLVERINRRVTTRVAVVLGCSALSLWGAYWLLPGAEYLPTGNKNLVFGFLFSPPGYSLEEFRRMGVVVEEGSPDDPRDGIRPFWEAEVGSQEAASLPPVEMQLGRNREYTRTVAPPPIENFFFVSFDGGAFMGCTSKEPTNVKPLENVMTRAGSRLPGVFTMFNQTSLFNTGVRRGGNTLDVEIRGDNLDEVVSAAIAIRGGIQQAGYDWPSASPANFDLGRPEIRLIPDREKAADIGLNVVDAGFILRACVDGAFVGEFNDRGNRIDLVLTMSGTKNATVEEIGSLPMYSPIGGVVPLGSAFRFERTTAPQEITRIEEMSAVTLSIKPKPGVPLQDTMNQVENGVIGPLRLAGAIPPTVITGLAGTADKLTQARRALMGDFRGTIQRPRLFGWSVSASMALLALAALIASAAAWVVSGARAAVWTILASTAVLIVGILVVNPKLSLELFQSRAFLSLLVTYLLMAALFESFAYPFVIMLSVPLAMIGGVATLDLVHVLSLYDPVAPIQQLDMLTMLGFVILIGVVVSNAILIVHQALNNMRDSNMPPKEAVAHSVLTRTRPIYMTAVTTVTSLIPLVFMPGAGSELYRGLGAVVLGGLIVSTVFTLVVVPAMFTLFLDAQQWLGSAANLKAVSHPGGALAPAPMVRSPHV